MDKEQVLLDSATNQKEQAYEKAKKRVRNLKRFYRSLSSSIFTILILAGINYYVNEWSHPWFLWVVFGLSISLFFKALKVYDFSIFSKEWEEKKIKRILENENKAQDFTSHKK